MKMLAKWLSVRLRTKWLWVRVQLQTFPYSSSTRETIEVDVVLAITLNIIHTIF